MKILNKVLTIIMVLGMLLILNSCDSNPTKLTIINNIGYTITSAHIRVNGANDWPSNIFTSELPHGLQRTVELSSEYPAGRYDIQLRTTDRIYTKINISLHKGSNTTTFTASDITTTITFAGMQWRVLDVQNNKALIISNDIVEQRAYHTSSTSITWEHCSLREYLNGTYYNSFRASDRAKIVEVTNQNPNNPTYGTPGGNPTQDKIFLLSLEEAEQYFSNVTDRVAYFNDLASWWWLRSPGNSSNVACNVHNVGDIFNWDFQVSSSGGGVRPALWLNL